jgi:hypothetical protein
MPRKVRDRLIDSREARRKLAPRDTCYWRAIERGMHLGYRRTKSAAGTWWVRHYVGSRGYEVERIGIADDLSDADGIAILDYWQAQEAARKRMVARAHAAAGKGGPFTVSDAMGSYFEFLEGDGRSPASIRDARYRDAAFIRPKLGDAEVAALTAERLRQWRDDIAKQSPRLRTREGQPRFSRLGGSRFADGRPLRRALPA